MNTQTVTPATARLLADAGFPQPAPAPGQWWYNKYGDLICWGHTVDSWGEPYEDATTFAPTVGDILWELGIRYDITVIKNGLSACILREGEAGEGSPEKSWLHKSEHEAAALAWLSLHENK